MYRSIIKLWTKACTDLNCTYECVWVTYQEGNRWLRSRCTMQNVGLIKNTLIKNTYALIFISHSSLNEWHYFALWYLHFDFINSLFFITLGLWLATGFCQGYMLYAHACLNWHYCLCKFLQGKYTDMLFSSIIILNKPSCAWWVF